VDFFSGRYKNLTDFCPINAEKFCENIEIPQLSDNDKQYLEQSLTEKELALALKSLNAKSAPGSDGLTPSFFKIFGLKLKTCT
jgi:hypothetical protein